MSLPSAESIKGALAALELATDGTYEEIHSRLGSHLVAKMLLGTSPPPTETTSATSSKANGKRPAADKPKAKKERKASEWVKFLSTERKKVADASPTATRAEVVRECARRWKLVKQANSSSAPLMITYEDSEAGSETADLTATLSELSSDEVKASLQAAGLDVSDNHTSNVAALAASMLH